MANRSDVMLVTGASTGIGRATALELGRHGFDVFAGVRRTADGEKVATAAEPLDGTVTPVIIDVTKPRSIAAAKRVIAKTAGKRGLSGLVNNAGVAVSGPFEYMDLDEFRDQLEVNVTGHLAVTQAMLPLLRTAHGRIVNVTSIGGLIAYPFTGPYHASKWALEAITHSLRTELQPWSIKVIAVEPGSIATDIWDRGLERADANRAKLGAGGEELYGDAMDAMTKTMRETADAGIPAQKAAKVIAKALTTRRPKTRYLVGRDARGALTGRRMLSDRAFDRLVTRLTGIPGRDSATGD